MVARNKPHLKNPSSHHQLGKPKAHPQLHVHQHHHAGGSASKTPPHPRSPKTVGIKHEPTLRGHNVNFSVEHRGASGSTTGPGTAAAGPSSTPDIGSHRTRGGAKARVKASHNAVGHSARHSVSTHHAAHPRIHHPRVHTPRPATATLLTQDPFIGRNSPALRPPDASLTVPGPHRAP